MVDTIIVMAGGMSSRMKKSESDKLDDSKSEQANKTSKSLITFGKNNTPFIYFLLKNISKFNMIITTGGASVGDEDHLVKALENNGKIFFWRAAIKPGRPIAVGKIQNTYIVCLPGNPVSVQLLYAFIVKPLILKLLGAPLKKISAEKLKTNFSMIKKTKRLEWLRVSKKFIKNEYVIVKHPKQGSGMISSISYSDGIVEIPEHVSSIKKGDIFNYYDFDKLFN